VKVVLQRVVRAAVTVGAEPVGACRAGFVAFVGVGADDSEADAKQLAAKAAALRIFADSDRHFNLSIVETEGEALVISQFTLLADTRKGRRPSFNAAAGLEVAEPLVEAFARELEEQGIRVGRGRFGAHMTIEAINDGPVTIVLDSDDLMRPRRS